MFHRSIILIPICLLIGLTECLAQEELVLEEAIRVALLNNFDIKLVVNELSVLKNEVGVGKAGFLPTLNATMANSNSVLNSRQVQSNGQVTDRVGAKNSSLNYGVVLNWNIFNGFAMFARYDQLKEQERLGQSHLQMAILTKVADVIGLYHSLVLQQLQLKAFDTAMVISNLRYDLAKNRYEIGRASKLELLNASVDLNTDTTNLLKQKELYLNTQISLNEQMGRELLLPFRVVDSIHIENGLILNELVTQAMQQSPSLQSTILSKRIAELDLKLLRASRYPSINLNTGYNFSNTKSALGFATQTSGQGLVYGVSANLNLFNGFVQRRNEMSAKLLIENAQLQYEKLNLNIRSQLTVAFQTYQTNLVLMQLEEKNKKIAKQNLEITLDKFQLGSISSLEMRAAQLNYVNASARYSNSLYDAKMAELTLKEISGTLNF